MIVFDTSVLIFSLPLPTEWGMSLLLSLLTEGRSHSVMKEGRIHGLMTEGRNHGKMREGRSQKEEFMD